MKSRTGLMLFIAGLFLLISGCTRQNPPIGWHETKAMGFSYWVQDAWEEDFNYRDHEEIKTHYYAYYEESNYHLYLNLLETDMPDTPLVDYMENLIDSFAELEEFDSSLSTWSNAYLDGYLVESIYPAESLSYFYIFFVHDQKLYCLEMGTNQDKDMAFETFNTIIDSFKPAKEQNLAGVIGIILLLLILSGIGVVFFMMKKNPSKITSLKGWHSSEIFDLSCYVKDDWEETIYEENNASSHPVRYAGYNASDFYLLINQENFSHIHSIDEYIRNFIQYYQNPSREDYQILNYEIADWTNSAFTGKMIISVQHNKILDQKEYVKQIVIKCKQNIYTITSTSSKNNAGSKEFNLFLNHLQELN